MPPQLLHALGNDRGSDRLYKFDFFRMSAKQFDQISGSIARRRDAALILLKSPMSPADKSTGLLSGQLQLLAEFADMSGVSYLQLQKHTVGFCQVGRKSAALSPSRFGRLGHQFGLVREQPEARHLPNFVIAAGHLDHHRTDPLLLGT